MLHCSLLYIHTHEMAVYIEALFAPFELVAPRRICRLLQILLWKFPMLWNVFWTTA